MILALIFAVAGYCASTSVASLAVVVIALIAYRYYSDRISGRYQLNTPPLAAPSWPLVGCLLSLADSKNGKPPYEILAGLVRQHGPVFRFDFGSFPTVIISSSAVIHEAFAKSSSFADRPNYPMFFNYGKGIIANTNNEVLKTQRRFYLSAVRFLTGKGKSGMEELLVKEVQDLITRMASRGKEGCEPAEDLAQTSANVVCSVLFGKHYTLNDVIFRDMLAYLTECYELAGHENERNFIPLLSYLPATKKARRSMEVAAKIKSLCYAFIEEALQKYTPNSPRCYVDMYFDTFIGQNASNGEINHVGDANKNICDETLVINIGDLLAAGTETSLAVASWGILLLAMHPEVQVKLQNEISSIVGTERDPKYQDRAHLPYVQAVIMEIQRVGCATPLGVPHCASSQTKLAGYDIPKDTALIANIWWVHNDPDVWEEPHLFRPERFLDPETNSVMRREELIPFSVGRRRCIGEDLATMELFLLFTHLLHKFTISVPDDEKPLTMAPRKGVTRQPCPFRIYLTPRE